MRRGDGATKPEEILALSPRPPVIPLPRLFYLNALFDLELGGHPVARVRAGALEMGPLFSFCGTRKDRVLLDITVPGEYWMYLDALGLPHALPLNNSDDPKNFTGVAWGWNEASINRFAALGVPVDHPDLPIVKNVNGRSFCAAFNSATNTGVPGTRFCRTAADLRTAVDTLCGQFPLVAKPAFGGSGHGFVVINNIRDVDGCVRDRLDSLISVNGCTIEPWCERIHDVSTSCVVSERGTIRDLRHYRCLTNRRGMFYGVTPGSQQDAVVENYRDDLENAANSACKALALEGYFGPVSFDSFVYRDASDGSEKLAAIIEINARNIMSTIAHALYSSVGDGRSCFFRFLSRCAIPAAYTECKDVLGDDWYDPQKRTGVIVLTPLRVSHGKQWVQPVRSAFFLAGSDRDETAAMDERLRKLFTPSKERAQ